MIEKTVMLWRPTGSKELALVEASGWNAWPPRLPEQPIFYPVCNEEYAIQIARDWNTQEGDQLGHVTRFSVRKSYIDKFERKIVGGRLHEEYWIPADQLEELNSNIVGSIELVATFTARDRLAHQSRLTAGAQ